MSEIVFKILGALIGIILTGVLSFALDYLKTKTRNAKFKHAMDIALMAVSAIEQQCKNDTGIMKKSEVRKYLYDKLGVQINEEEIEHIIEAAVFQMNTTIKAKLTDPANGGDK
jgi:LL-H family phage holin